MVKRISCRVVRSKPLGRSSPPPLLSCEPQPPRLFATSRQMGQDAAAGESKKRGGYTLNKVHHKIGDVVTGIPQGKYADNLVRDAKAHKLALGTLIYTGLLDITSISIDNDLTGQILDCYV